MNYELWLIPRKYFLHIVEDTEITKAQYPPSLNHSFFASILCINWAICCLDLIQSKTKTYLTNALKGMVSQMIYIMEWSKPECFQGRLSSHFPSFSPFSVT